MPLDIKHKRKYADPKYNMELSFIKVLENDEKISKA